ncbi:PGP [Cervus elaphus hippelaphus]|uniref:PGP n=1 Tax=Cervus elaphus hippelaphus TaxID=46360 RepID=A0A212CZ61_CEREH|nr:PGP [Cervus elaphus hippelaphus]
MVGDRLDTDILLGVTCGLKTILTLTGVSSLRDVKRWERRKGLLSGGASLSVGSGVLPSPPNTSFKTTPMSQLSVCSVLETRAATLMQLCTSVNSARLSLILSKRLSVWGSDSARGNARAAAPVRLVVLTLALRGQLKEHVADAAAGDTSLFGWAVAQEPVHPVPLPLLHCVNPKVY